MAKNNTTVFGSDEAYFRKGIAYSLYQNKKFIKSLASSQAKLKSSTESVLMPTVRLPLRHNNADFIIRKDSLHPIHEIT